MKFLKPCMIFTFEETKISQKRTGKLRWSILEVPNLAKKAHAPFPNGSLSFNPPLRTNSAICATIEFGGTLPKCRQSRDF